MARVFHHDPQGWVLKGGQALLVRWPAARYSTDVDLLSAEDTVDAAVKALKRAAEVQLDDHLSFEHYESSAVANMERRTQKIKFRVMAAHAELTRVSVDVVASSHLPHGKIVTAPLVPTFATDCKTWPEIRMYPLEDHVAEKICAMYEMHGPAATINSSRYKDLVDLVLIMLKETLEGRAVHTVLHKEAERRIARGTTLTLPAAFTVPNKTWDAGYRAAAAGVRELSTEFRSLTGVMDLADAFVTPLLQTAPPAGQWHPAQRSWQ
ncbi:nucleotidyl transferase AbiEii/AbiGii toxin family protein [Amycolatopsis jejuensis]|uniref:nucleotidyl transferase AbiEii/AbiGii toxin family protein n=1 Tax=Amycolatopsis jejuensis TaxID=330084 RepID=UPI001FE0220C|nr:nucleotidyl transferase AbiEii/AbiGii toxin family protein [Amycolatopsis jejuensis]